MKKLSAVLSIVFDYTNQYGSTSREYIIGEVEANENGEFEYKAVMDKIKKHGYAKSRVELLEVTYYNQLISTGQIELV